MSNSKQRIKTQWNSYARPFDSFSDDEINGLLGFCSDTTKVAEKLSGKQCYLAYGALLGHERSGKLIPHDFDIDVAINCGRCSRDEVAEVCRKLMVSFIDAGYEVKAKCFAQFFVLPPKEVKQRYKVEFFASWIEDEKYYLYFALPGVDIVDDIFPLKTVDLQGHEFYVPKNTSALLSATYGEDWEIPNSDFKYDMTGGRWAPFTSYFYSRNVKQWNDFYSEENLSDLMSVKIEHGDFVVSSEQPQAIMDIGCGVGAVAVELARAGHKILALDSSEIAINNLTEYKSDNNLSNLTATLINLHDVYECEKVGAENDSKIDMVIANNVLQHLSLVAQTTLLKLAGRVLTSDGEMLLNIASEYVVVVEEQAVVTEANKKAGIPFYTRKICINELQEKAQEHNLVIEKNEISSDGSMVQLRLKLDPFLIDSASDGATRMRA